MATQVAEARIAVHAFEQRLHPWARDIDLRIHPESGPAAGPVARSLTTMADWFGQDLLPTESHLGESHLGELHLDDCLVCCEWTPQWKPYAWHWIKTLESRGAGRQTTKRESIGF